MDKLWYKYINFEYSLVNNGNPIFCLLIHHRVILKYNTVVFQKAIGFISNKGGADNTAT